MNRLTLCLCAFLLLSACASVKERVALIPDPDGKVGQVTVSTKAGSTTLGKEGEAAEISKPDAPPDQSVMPQEEIQSRFGRALAAQPPEPVHFLLYFQTGGTTLTEESKNLLPELIVTSQQRQPSEVYVVGHTDTMGDSSSNERLGMSRALEIRNLLIGQGIPEFQISTTSHGEGNLLIPTADNVDEMRNRRVEVTIR